MGRRRDAGTPKLRMKAAPTLGRDARGALSPSAKCSRRVRQRVGGASRPSSAPPDLKRTRSQPRSGLRGATPSTRNSGGTRSRALPIPSSATCRCPMSTLSLCSRCCGRSGTPRRRRGPGCAGASSAWCRPPKCAICELAKTPQCGAAILPCPLDPRSPPPSITPRCRRRRCRHSWLACE